MSASIHNTHFLLRRIHSLFGFLPVGGFLMFHMWENSQSRLGRDHYNEHVVEAIKSMNYVLFIEIFVLALPILFHALYGLLIWWQGRTNVTRYKYFHNFMYFTQRLSGWGILAFLIYHVGWTRIWSIWKPSIEEDMYGHMQALLSNPIAAAAYVIGMILAVIHFTNGLWTMGITWGVTTTPKAQKISYGVCTALAVLLIAFGIHSLVGFFLEPSAAAHAATLVP